MDRSLLIEDVPIKTSIYRGFPFAMFYYRRATSMMKTANCITKFVGNHLESFEKGRGYCVSVIFLSLIECADILYIWLIMIICIYIYIWLYNIIYICIYVLSCTHVWLSDYSIYRVKSSDPAIHIFDGQSSNIQFCVLFSFCLSSRNSDLLNVAVHNLPRFRVSSKHVAGSISEGVMCLTLMLCPCLSRFGPKRGS